MRFSFLPLLLLLSLCSLLRAAETTPPHDPIEGSWTGTITAPQGEEAAIGFEFFRTPDRTLGFKLHFPAMFVHGASLGIPVEAIGASDYRITPSFAIVLHREGDVLTGTFSSAKLPLQLHRGPPPNAVLAVADAPPAPEPAWRYALGAATWAPPVASDGTAYVGASDGRFHAVDTTTGRARWVWSGGIAIDGAAACDATRVYFLDTRFNLTALDRQRGTLLWRVSVHDEFLAGRSIAENPTFNHRAATPLIHDDVLYIGSGDGGLYAIDPASGAKRWRHDAGSPIFSGIGLRDSDTLAFGTMDGAVILLDRRNQREIWRGQTNGGVVTTPVFADGRVVVGSRDYQLHAFNLGDSSVAWKFSYWFSWIESTPALRDGTLYVGGSDYARVTAIDPVTGRARWSTIVGGMDWGTPLVTDNAVFIGTVNQNLAGTLIPHQAGLVKLDRRTGKLLWRLPLPKAPAGEFAGFAGSLTRAGDLAIGAGFDGNLWAWPIQ